jgi:hypothetical protein
MRTRVRTAVFAVTLAFLGAAMPGCTFQSVKPEVSLAPPQQYTTFILGEIRAEDRAWDGLQHHFRKGVVEWLKEKKAFETVLDTAPAAPVGSAITLSGTITEIDKGSVALRILVGMGAGQAKVKGVFEIKDSAGSTLVKFAARESYLGGAGMGGAGLLDMDDLVKRFGETVAQTALKWSRGEPIE